MLDIRRIMDQKHLVLDAAVSLAIMAAVFYFIGIDAIIREFSGINYIYLAFSVIFLLLMYLGMAARLHLVLSELGARMKFQDIMRMHFVGMLLADFTPARTGYFAVAYGLTKKHRVPEEKSIVAVLGPQIYDFVLKVVAGTAGLLYLLKVYLRITNGEVLFLGAFVMMGMVAVMVLLLFSKSFLSIFSFTRGVPIADRVFMMFEKAQQNSKVILHQFPALSFLLMYNWITKAISWFFVAKALNITLFVEFSEVFVYFFLQPLLTMLEFLPSPTLAGLGLSEGGGVLLFSVFGIGAAKAASFVFLARVKTIIVNLIGVRDTLSLVRPR